MPWPRRKRKQAEPGSAAEPEPAAPAAEPAGESAPAESAPAGPAGSQGGEADPLLQVRTLTQRDHEIWQEQQQQQEQGQSRRGPGRPRTSEPRSRQASVGLSETEHAAWTRAAEQAGYKQLGRWVRAVIADQLDQQQQGAGEQDQAPGQQSGAGGELGQVRDQLRRIGTNLNQLTRALNKIAVMEKQASGDEILSRLEDIRAEMARLREWTLSQAGIRPAKSVNSGYSGRKLSL